MNRMQLIRSLAPGFMPLIIFILADSIWGTQVGLVTAVVFGAIELAVSWYRERVVDRFLLLDIGLIILLGLASLWKGNDLFFKLKPAVIEVFFAVILGISAWSSRNIVWMMSRRYMKGLSLDSSAMTKMRHALRPLFWIFLAHAGLTVYAAVAMSRQAWAFISGGLFYLVFLGLALFGIVKKRLVRMQWKRLYADDEWFDLVDESGRVTGRAPRVVCHSAPGMLHPVVHLHILDGKDRVFLQKRPLSKLIQPGKWDTAVGGHVHSGEKVEDALKREAHEELGLREFRAVLLGVYRWDSEVESELVYLFLARYSGPFDLNPDEVDDGKFWRIRQVRDRMGTGTFTQNFEYEFPLLVENHQKVLA